LIDILHTEQAALIECL